MNTKPNRKRQYEKLLEKTKGAWGSKESKENETERSKIELKATKEAKKSW